MDWPERTYLVNHRLKLVYCPVPKAACTSIKLWFLRVSGIPRPQALPCPHVFANKNATLARMPHTAADEVLRSGEYFKFAIVRDPWRRLVSAYLDKVLPVGRVGRHVVKAVQRRHWKQLGKQLGYSARILRWWSGIDNERAITFREFMHYLASLRPMEKDEHWRPQHLFLGLNDFDLVLKAESLPDSFSLIQRRLGTNVPLPHSNDTRYEETVTEDFCVADWPARRLKELPGFPPYQNFYTPELIELVKEIYAEDIRLFGYEFSLTAKTTSRVLSDRRLAA